MFRFLRPAGFPRTPTAHLSKVTLEDGTSSMEFHSPDSDYMMTVVVPHNASLMNPPLHIHLNQDETFEVFKGQGNWYMPRHANPDMRKVTLSSATSDAEGRRVTVPTGAYHRFENPSTDEPLVVGVRLDKQDWEMEERFFRNFLCYLDDARKAGVAPSMFQLMRFLWEFECPLGLPCPGPQWLGVAVSKAFCGFMGVIIGEGLLGYKGTYTEYYNPNLNK